MNGTVAEESPFVETNMPLVGIDVVVNWNEVLRQPNPRKFRAHKRELKHIVTILILNIIPRDVHQRR